MRTMAPPEEVRAAVRECATGSDHAVQANWKFLAAVAKSLDLTIDENSRAGRADLQALTGQVRRALQKLADGGELVKVIRAGRQTWYWPPALHEQYAAAEARARAAKADARQLWERLYDEAALHGYSSTADRGKPLDLNPHDWMRLLDVLQAAATARETM